MKLIGPFKQLLTMAELPARGPLSDDRLEIRSNQGILVREGKIEAIDDFHKLEAESNPKTIEFLNEDYVALPGMIDVHTHICWAGTRAEEYALRLSGANYRAINAAGGGIWNTVGQTRQKPMQELAAVTAVHARQLLEQGITTIEVKSGYGLAVDQELKILQAIAEAAKKSKADLIPTCLAAHMLPKDFEGGEVKYLDHILNELLPVVLKKGLSRRVDIFVDSGAFSVPAARDFLFKVRDMGFDRIVHGDQFTAGAAQLATETGALSIDHLEAADDREIAILAGGNTIPVVLPGASMGLGMPFAPARRLLDAGTSLVIASDWNPGSAPMGNLLIQAAILGAAQKLTMAETWAALTCRASLALNLNDRGSLETGKLADIMVFKTDNYQDILYHQGYLPVERVWKNGRCAYKRTITEPTCDRFFEIQEND